MHLTTVGHGTLGQEELAQLLRQAGIALVVDVRTAPGSRRHPHLARAQLEHWLPKAGIAYRWEPRLGGWRKPIANSANTALHNQSFRGYADYMSTEEFWLALDQLLAEAASQETAVMCSEAIWWRCHRRLIADAASLVRGATVSHLGHNGQLTSHVPTEGVRTEGESVVYDGGQQALGELPGKPCLQ
jgi:uncharacterized protein (DUF488 family)